MVKRGRQDQRWGDGCVPYSEIFSAYHGRLTESLQHQPHGLSLKGLSLPCVHPNPGAGHKGCYSSVPKRAIMRPAQQLPSIKRPTYLADPSGPWIWALGGPLSPQLRRVATVPKMHMRITLNTSFPSVSLECGDMPGRGCPCDQPQGASLVDDITLHTCCHISFWGNSARPLTPLGEDTGSMPCFPRHSSQVKMVLLSPAPSRRY